MPSDKMGDEGYSVRRGGGGENLEDDVEGHGVKSRPGASDDDDVEGHGVKSRPGAADDDDVEGHGGKVF